MELLPIIYWSLMGFGILTLFVIITAYLTYQFRKRVSKIPSKNSRSGNSNIIGENFERDSNFVGKHHPKVVKQIKRKISTNNLPNQPPSRKDRITVLNDLLTNEDSKENRFNHN